MNCSKTVAAILILCLSCFCGCTNASKARLNEFADMVDKKVFNDINRNDIHKGGHLKIAFPSSIKYLEYCGLFVELEEYSFKGSGLNHLTVSLNDSCIVYVGRDEATYCKGSILPILDFKSDLFYTSELSGELELYVLNKEIGQFVDESFLIEKNSMPAEAKHGFSNGYIVNKATNKVFFWIVIW